VLEVSGMSITVRLYTKDSDDVGDGVEVDSTTTISTSTTGRRVSEWGPGTGIGIKELVRYKVVAVSTGLSPTVTLRMLDNCWFDTVRSPGLP
jgi:hypothetical protein